MDRVTVDVQELQNKLNRYLNAARTGGEVTVIDEGKAIARIVPFHRESELERMVRDGIVRPPTRSRTPLPEPIHADGTVSDLLTEQRR